MLTIKYLDFHLINYLKKYPKFLFKSQFDKLILLKKSHSTLDKLPLVQVDRKESLDHNSDGYYL